VRVPAGIESGKKLRVAKRGEEGPGGAGDLLLVVTVEADPRFERRGADLYTIGKIPPSTLLLGGGVEVETFDGMRTLKIESGTPSSRMMRIRGAGVPRMGGEGRGDLYVRLEISVPLNLSEAQLAAGRMLRDAGL
jgi:DnaJ-class molecular chaperone